MKLLIQHPPLRIVTVLLAIIGGVSMHRLPLLGILLLFGQLVLALWGVPLQAFWRRFRLGLPFMMFSLLFFAIYESGSGLQLLPWLTLSAFGLEKGLIYAARLIFSLQMLTLVFYRVSIPTFFHSLVLLRIPTLITELILFTLRFMDVIRAEALSMLRALKSRGLRAKQLYSVRYYRLLAGLLGQLLLRSLSRSERIYLGMMARGYRGIVPRPDIPKLQAPDWLRASLLLLPVLAVFFLDLR